ncbi:MAG: RNA-binding protein [Candidatus Electrothrix sp. ATG2]|nr:RNA-binding protein [Candidatus Electrothrix sp. ATG2]
MKLFVGSLPYNITENELTDLFSQYGSVVSLNLVTDHFTGQPKGFAFVEMATRSEGHKAMENLNGKKYKHRDLVCNESKPTKKKKRSRRR